MKTQPNLTVRKITFNQTVSSQTRLKYVTEYDLDANIAHFHRNLKLKD